MAERLASSCVPTNNPAFLSGRCFLIAIYYFHWNWPFFLAIFVKDDIRLMMHTVSSPDLLEDAKNIDPVLATDSWQTLMTFTRESGRESFFMCDLWSNLIPISCPALLSFSPDSVSTNSLSGGPSGGMMDSDIPQEVLDQIAAEEASHGGVSRGSTGGSSGTSSGIRVCPHCTFENDHRGTDCEVCGLPLVWYRGIIVSDWAWRHG